MINNKIFFIFALLVISTYSCPKGCATCKDDQTQCYTCNQGYQLYTKTKLCVPDYTKQSQWTGDCNSGSKQTPIDIDTTTTVLCPSGFSFYQDTSTSLKSTKPGGADMLASYIDQSTVTYIKEGKTEKFSSLQFHWHAPSQHTVNGKHFDLELHIVHANTDGSGKLAVTGLFFNIDKDAKTDILDEYNFFQSDSAKEFMFPIFLKNKLVYHYQGSLTTPPCSEIVTWFIYTEHFPLTHRNYDLLKEEIHEGHTNSRNVQNLNGRTIYLTGGFCNSMNFVV